MLIIVGFNQLNNHKNKSQSTKPLITGLLLFLNSLIGFDFQMLANSKILNIFSFFIPYRLP